MSIEGLESARDMHPQPPKRKIVKTTKRLGKHKRYRLLHLVIKRDDNSLTLVDTNGNGIPDAFENRPPLTEILNAPEGSLACDTTSVIVEVEKVARPPKRGEWYISAGKIQKSEMNFARYGSFTAIVVKRIVAGKLP
jgi:hypothetical protein